MPIPSWKRRANPLPPLIARELSVRLGAELNTAVLSRSRPVLGQHHLGRQLRLANQEGAFAARPAPAKQIGPRPPVLLIDDILTTGATACAAANALTSAGWRLAGLACLARTPARGRSRGRQ
jgi:predicted amidophosphoribosyltransferase